LEQEHLLNKYFELLVLKLDEKIDGPSKGRVDMMAQYNFLAFDIIRFEWSIWSFYAQLTMLK